MHVDCGPAFDVAVEAHNKRVEKYFLLITHKVQIKENKLALCVLQLLYITGRITKQSP